MREVPGNLLEKITGEMFENCIYGLGYIQIISNK